MTPTPSTTKRAEPRAGRPLSPWFRCFAAPLVVGLGGCGGEPATATTSFPAEAYATVTSVHQALVIAVRTGPAQPPERGLVDVELTVKDAAAEPVSGLSIRVVPWMPAMDHGAPPAAAVEAREGGRYVVAGLGLFMPGRWELRTSFEGAVRDDATIPLQIP